MKKTYIITGLACIYLKEAAQHEGNLFIFVGFVVSSSGNCHGAATKVQGHSKCIFPR